MKRVREENHLSVYLQILVCDHWEKHRKERKRPTKWPSILLTNGAVSLPEGACAESSAAAAPRHPASRGRVARRLLWAVQQHKDCPTFHLHHPAPPALLVMAQEESWPYVWRNW